MIGPKESFGIPDQPPLADVFRRYLQRQAAAHAAGLAGADTRGEVVPFEAVPVQAVDPGLAWEGAIAVLGQLQPGLPVRSLEVPPDWASLVASPEPVLALAFAAGNFPQLVSSLHALLHRTDLSALRPAPTHPVPGPDLLAWASEQARQQRYPQVLLAVGVLRLAGHFDQAVELVRQQTGPVPGAWQAAWANEEAALAWHRGQAEAALELWQTQAPSVPVLFNRGMAALFLGRPIDARAELIRAVNQLPEDEAWHHLGRLYLALAEMRG